MPATKNNLLIDANVLIDFQNSDFSLLELVNRHIGSVYIVNRILNEVNGVAAEDCTTLGLTVFEPEQEICIEAETRIGKLSVNDNLCLLSAQKSGYICVTNDKNLRKYCEEKSVRTMWGLELIQLLVENNVLDAEEAVRIVEKIHRKSPLYFPTRIVDQFAANVRNIGQ